MDTFISKEILDMLSYRSSLGQSLNQRDNMAYPIEVQLWCGEDYLFNLWSHKHVYKYLAPKVGQRLYREYSDGQIQTEQDFLKRLCNLG